MTNDERLALFREMRAIEDPKERMRSPAREKLILGHDSLVMMVLKKRFPQRSNPIYSRWFDEMRSAGRVALIEAVDACPESSVPYFLRYARTILDRELRYFIYQSSSPLSVPRHAIREVSRSRAGLAPGPGEAYLEPALLAVAPSVSLGHPGDPGGSFLEIGREDPAIAAVDERDGATVAAGEMSEVVAKLLSPFKGRCRQMLAMRYGLDGLGERSRRCVAMEMGYATPGKVQSEEWRMFRIIRKHFPGGVHAA